MTTFEKLERCYNSFYDEKSKDNFINRLRNNLSKDGSGGKYLVNMIADNCKNIPSPNIAQWYKGGGNGKQLIVYGAFTSGKTRYDFSKYLGLDDIYCFCDKDVNKQNKDFCGKRVISPEELVKNYKNYYVLIETKYYYDEVYNYLIDNGFPKENIVAHGDNGIQYLDYEYMEFDDNEIMIDGGCFDCGTIKDFISRVGGKYNKIIAFEPDYSNYIRCKQILEKENIERVEVINKGLWDKETRVGFCGNEESCSRISENDGEDSIETISIDQVAGKEKITFIKMDIEGAELKALMGAKNVIMRDKPKLAICIYHKPEDILDIQEYLLELVPDYRFGIRHYTDHAFETVLYAF